MVFVKEVLQFCVAVTYAIAVELQDVASLKDNTCSWGVGSNRYLLVLQNVVIANVAGGTGPG